MKPERKYSLLLIALAYLSFVSLGLPDGLNGVAWPSVRGYFNLPLDALGSLLVMFTAGYLVSSFSSGRILALMSLGSLLALSCLATAVSLIGYALVSSWWVMVALGVLAGLGAGAIDAGLNTFAATQFSARMVNWLHACYGVGAASGPVIMTRVLAAHHPWQRGYAIVGVWQLLLAICFGLTRRWWPKAPVLGQLTSHSAARPSNIKTLKLPVVWLSIVVFFLYTGIEAAAGTWAYSLFTESRDVSMMTAGIWVSVYWGGLSVGRLLAGVAVGSIPANRLLRLCASGMAVGAALIWLNVGALSSLGLGLMGFASAPVFPSLIATTPARLGPEHTSNGIGFQIAAAVLGQALFPAFVGVLAGKLGLEIIGPALFVAAVMLLALVLGLTSASLAINGQPPCRVELPTSAGLEFTFRLVVESTMPEISRFLGIVIRMYFNDHNPPHFHVAYNESEASVLIETLGILEGRLPPKVLSLTVEWASLHQVELLENWESIRASGSYRPIEPLT